MRRIHTKWPYMSSGSRQPGTTSSHAGQQPQDVYSHFVHASGGVLSLSFKVFHIICAFCVTPGGKNMQTTQKSLLARAHCLNYVAIGYVCVGSIQSVVCLYNTCASSSLLFVQDRCVASISAAISATWAPTDFIQWLIHCENYFPFVHLAFTRHQSISMQPDPKV